MTTLVKITLAFLLALFLASCGLDMNLGKNGNGIILQETRAITENFTAVSASEGVDVYVTQADTFGISVEADENIIDLIGTSIRNGELCIHTIKNIGKSTKKVYVSMPQIYALESSSGANLHVANTVDTPRLQLISSSGSILKIEVNSGEVRVQASSGANIQLSGETETFFASASSGANIKAGELQAKICTANAHSGATINLNVSETLVADAHSGGNVTYTGEANVQKKHSFSGQVNKI